MKGDRVGCMLFSVVLFTSVAEANGGVINFSGQVVNTGCAVQPLSDHQPFEAMREVRVSSEITLVVDTYRNACSGGAIPFSPVFTALNPLEAEGSAGFSVDRTSTSGVVTLTYQ